MPLALARSTHPGPAVAVTLIALVLAVTAGLEPWRVAVLAIAVLLDQASVGLSNDWLDRERDASSGRTDKPVALGLVPASTARTAAFVTAALALLITIPLGWWAVVAHVVFLGSAWAYNLGLKNSVLSVAPYIVSFGTLPLIATLARSSPAPAAWWAMGAGALLGVSAHFANVLPDLADDAATGVRGLPHRTGGRGSGAVIALALVAASALVAFGDGSPTPVRLFGFALCSLLGALTLVLVLTRPPTRILFQLIIATALVDVALLAASGRAILG